MGGASPSDDERMLAASIPTPSRSNLAKPDVILQDVDGALIVVTAHRKDNPRAAAEVVLKRSIDPPES